MWVHYIADMVIWGAFVWFAWSRNAFQNWGWPDWFKYATLAAIPAILAHIAIKLVLR